MSEHRGEGVRHLLASLMQHRSQYSLSTELTRMLQVSSVLRAVLRRGSGSGSHRDLGRSKYDGTFLNARAAKFGCGPRRKVRE